MSAAGTDVDRAQQTRPDDHVNPNTDLADLYEDRVDCYLTSVEASRELWGRASLRHTAGALWPEEEEPCFPFSLSDPLINYPSPR